MAEISEMSTALDILSSSGSQAIPGLDFESVISNMAEVQVKAVEAQLLEATGDAEAAKKEAKEMKKDLKKFLSGPEAKALIKIEINNIKLSFKELIAGLKQLPESVTATTAAAVQPAVITVPPGAPNVAQTILVVKSNINTFKTIIGVLAIIIAGLLASGIKIKFKLPDQVMKLINTIKQVKQKIDAVPI